MLSVYLKPTNFCNVDCEHCYLPSAVRANKERMSPEMLHKVMSFLKEMKDKNKHNQVFLIWHGGEPLILPINYFEMAGEIIDQYFPEGQLIEAIQTSLIPYRKEHASIVKNRWRGEIGTSIDFNSRLIKGSVAEYQKLWLSKVDMARSDDILVIPGMVPNKKDCKSAKEIFNWFRDRNFWIWGIDRYTNIGGVLPEMSTNREHAQFLIDLFDCTIESIHKTGKAPFIKAIAGGIGGVLYDTPGDRWGGTCQSDFIVVNPNGTLNNCPDKDSFEPSYGNINEGVSSFEGSPLRKKWIRIQQAGHRIDECYQCENASWCKSGCPITGNACNINGIIDECSGYKSFINHVRDFIKKDESNKEILVNYLNNKFIPDEAIYGIKENSTFSNLLIAN
jgi:radical SAM protein with 4Fe4S-binding SPASM domain